MLLLKKRYSKFVFFICLSLTHLGFAAEIPDWMDLTPPNIAALTDTYPQAREKAGMASDFSKNQIILFGGLNSSGANADQINLSDTWSSTYDIKTQRYSWTNQKTLPAESPPGRNSAGFAANTETSQIVMFGGYFTSFVFHQSVNTANNDTWIYNGNTNAWVQKRAAPLALTARGGTSLVFNQANKKFLLFGGEGDSGFFVSNPTFYNETWEYDSTADQWQNITPLLSTDSPSARSYASVAADPKTGTIVLFGGLGADGAISNETWIYDAVNKIWTLVSPSQSPSARFGASFVFDPNVTNQFILFGGSTSADSAHPDYSDETWAYDPTTNTWSNLTSTLDDSPSARSFTSLAFDSIGRDAILFGGVSSAGELAETWKLVGTILSPKDVEAFGTVVPTTFLRAKSELPCDQFNNVIKWKSPKKGSKIVSFRIFSDKHLKKLVAQVKNHKGKLRYIDKDVKPCKKFEYYVVSVDPSGNISAPVFTKIPKRDFCD